LLRTRRRGKGREVVNEGEINFEIFVIVKPALNITVQYRPTKSLMLFSFKMRPTTLNCIGLLKRNDRW